MTSPQPTFAHLRRLSDDVGLFEHALGTVARRETGYCVDDVARGLVVVCRESQPTDDPLLAGLAEAYLAFVLAAQDRDGRIRNRRAVDGTWQDVGTVEDCWGRALWGLGAAVASGMSDLDRARAAAAFRRAAVWRSPDSRAMAFAGLGAAALLAVHPDDAAATALLADAASRVGRPATTAWPWPEPRLRYANAALPEVLLAAGVHIGDESLVADGLNLLSWLLSRETRDGHLSVTPVAGRGPSDVGPAFDQQPIEVAALADACARAFAITGDAHWAIAVQSAADWLCGRNDAGTVLYDGLTGGGYDGLEAAGRNENQGAESTLAALSVLQQATRVQALVS